jgi:ubiquinone/menaquinone biosynthesis C-methylase UbiE/uncharacterized protein YbaR (Trm112 family)
MNEPAPDAHFLDYCCPQCKGPLARQPHTYSCGTCNVRYPVVLGIPDFRVFPDPYISIEDDHRKGSRIAELAGSGASFTDLVRFYWSITPEEPPEMAERFTAQAIAATDRGRHLLDGEPVVKSALETNGGKVLDLGSRTGGLLQAAAEQCREVVGVDIAFRWLIVARKRLEEAGRPVQLVCCCAEYLPFKAGSFNVVLAENVLEHTQRQQPLIDEAHRVLAPRGVFFATTWNRLAAAPEPHVRLWGVGWMPRVVARTYVRWRKGVGYDHVRLISFFQLNRMTRRAGFRQSAVGLPTFSAAQLANVSPRQRRILELYHRMKDWPVVNIILRIVGPVLHLTCTRDAK